MMTTLRQVVARGRILPVIAMALVVAGCAESQRPQASGKGAVRGINAVATAPEMFFLIEERLMGNVNYRGIAGFEEWDDLEYNFNFDILLPGDTVSTRIATQFVDVQVGIEYSVALTGTLDNPTIISWEAEEREFDGTENFFELDFVNLSPMTGEVDIYFDLEGTPPQIGMEVGRIAFGDRIDYVQITQPGSYVLTLTAPGDPATVVFQSDAFPRVTGERLTFMLSDPDPSITSPVGVDLIPFSGSSQRMADINSPPQIRVLHAAFGVQNFDGYLDENLANLVFPNVAFQELSVFADAAEVLLPLTLTAVGDTSTELFTVDIQQVLGTLRSVFIFGTPDEVLARPIINDARPLSTYPVVRITHLSSNIPDGIDVYEVDPGTELTEDVFPKFGGSIIGISTGFFAADSGMREYILTLPGEKDPIATPVVFDLADGDIVDLAIVDTADPAVVELITVESSL